MKYRFRLGRELGSDIITDGSFAQAIGVNWNDEDAGGTWTIAANKATHTGATYNYLNQDCGFVPGTKYKIEFTVSDIPGGGSDYVQLYISGFSITTNSDNNYYKNANGTFILYGTCLSTDSYIRFMAYGTVSVSRVSALPYDWNEPLINHPKDWDNDSISLTKSELLDGFYVKYIDNLDFWGDGYDYLLAKYNTLSASSPKEFCELIYLKIERLVNSVWEEHFIGIIYLNKSTFNLKQKIVSVSVEDIASSQIVKFGADKVLGTSYQNRNVYDATNKFEYPSTLCAVRLLTGGATSDRYVYFLFNALRNIVHEITDLSVTIDSDLLLTTPYEGIANVYQYLGLTPFKNFSTDVNTYTLYGSFNEFTNDLNGIVSIGGLSSYANNIPTLNIESKLSLKTGTYTFALDNNNGEFNFYEQDNYQAVDVGFARPDNNDFTTMISTISTFVYTGQIDNWKTDKYYSKLKCTENEISYVNELGAEPAWIGWQLIYPEYNPSNPNGPPVTLPAPFTPQIFWLQMEINAVGPPVTYKSRYVNLPDGVGANSDFNNPDLQITSIIDRHVFNLNSSFNSAIWGAADKINNPLIRTWEFEAPLTLSQLDEIVANPNYAIQMTSNYFTGTINGYIVEFERPNKSDASGKSLARFKILSE